MYGGENSCKSATVARGGVKVDAKEGVVRLRSLRQDKSEVSSLLSALEWGCGVVHSKPTLSFLIRSLYSFNILVV